VALLALADGGWRFTNILRWKSSNPSWVRARGKGQVQELVKLLLGLEAVPQPDDAADAFGDSDLSPTFGAHDVAHRERTIIFHKEHEVTKSFFFS